MRHRKRRKGSPSARPCSVPRRRCRPDPLYLGSRLTPLPPPCSFESAISQAFQAILASNELSVAYQQFAEVMTTSLVWQDLGPATSYYKGVIQTPWDMAREFIRNARNVAYYPSEWQANMTYYDAFRYVIDNSPLTLYDQLTHALSQEAPITLIQLRQTVLILTVLVLVEGVFVVPLCALLIYRAVMSVMHTRMSLFSVFLLLPRPMVMSLATKEIKLDEDESGDEMDDDIEFERSLMKASGRSMRGPRRSSGLIGDLSVVSSIGRLTGPLDLFFSINRTRRRQRTSARSRARARSRPRPAASSRSTPAPTAGPCG